MSQFTACPDPDCGCIAEITDRFDLASTGGPVSHVATYCARRHIFRLPASLVTWRGPSSRPVTTSATGRQDG
jgi:hypothetical protein